MSEIKQPKLVLDEETARLAKGNKLMRILKKDEVIQFAIFTGVFVTGVGLGAHLMNEGWKAELTKIITEAAQAAATD